MSVWPPPAGGGSGDFVGPAGAVTNNLVSFANNTGKLGADSGVAAAALIASIPTGNTLWVDATNGNDGTALPDRQDLPYLTVAAALAAVSSGDTVILRPGLYAEEGLTLPQGVALVGQGGWQVTEIGLHAAASDIIQVSDQSSIEGIAFLVPSTAGLAGVRYTGVVDPTFSIYNCNFYGDRGAGAGMGDGLVKNGAGKIIGAEIRGDRAGMNALLRVDLGVLALESIHVPPDPAGGTINAVALCERAIPGAAPPDPFNSGRFQLVDINAGNPNIVDVIRMDGGSAVVFGINTFNVQNNVHVTADNIKLEVLGGKMAQSGYSVEVDAALTGVDSIVRITANHQPDYFYPPLVAANADFGMSFFQEATETKDSLQRTLGTNVEYGFPERGSSVSLGEGGSYSTGMVVVTTDGTAATNADGGNITDVSADAASKSGSTITFQGLSAGHSIAWTTQRFDASGAGLRHYSISILQDAAAVLGAGNFIFEIKTGSGPDVWSPVAVMAVSSEQSYRYADNVFLRASSEEDIFFNIDSSTTWPEEPVDITVPAAVTVTGRWCRVRIETAITTLPTFERFRLGTSHTVMNTQGQRISKGLAMWRETIDISSIQWSGAGLANGTSDVGSGADAYTHEFDRATLNAITDVAYGTFKLPSGVCTAFPITVKALYSYNAAVGAPTLEARVTPAMVQANLIADPGGNIVPIERPLADTRATDVDLPNVFSIVVPTPVLDTLYQQDFGPVDVSEFYEGDFVFLRIQMTNDGGGGGSDINLIGLSVEGVSFTEGAIRS